MRQWWFDLRYAARSLRRSPLYAAVGILALGVGIGANVAIFSVVSGVYFHDLGYRGAGDLVMVWEDQEERGGTARSPTSIPTFVDWRQRAGSVLSDVAALRNESRRLTDLERPVAPLTHLVTENYFDLLGVRPVLGRGFQPGDAEVGDVALLSEGLWHSAFGGRSDIVGSTISLDLRPVTLIGVVGDDFYSHHLFPTQPDLWLPLDPDGDDAPRSLRNVIVFGRLAPDVTLDAASGVLERIADEVGREHPQTNQGWSVRVETVRDNAVGDLRQTFLILLSVVGVVLLMACANVGNLMLARGALRSREVALRTALGAGRWRIVRLLLAEALVLGAGAGLLGVLLALLLVPPMTRLIPQGAGVPFIEHVAVDATVLGYALLLTLASSLVFGLVPARSALRPSLVGSLKEGRSGGRGDRRRGEALIVAEVALAMVVAVLAGLLGQSFLELRGFDPGFDPEDLVTWRTSLRAGPEDGAAVVAHFADVEERIAALSGVESVGSVSFPPPLSPRFVVRVEPSGAEAAPEREHRAVPRVVTPGYFETVALDLLAGRHFDGRDGPDSAPVMIVNRELQRRVFEGREVLGRTLSLGDDAREQLGPGVARTIVGVVDDVLSGGADPSPQPAFYLPHSQAPIPILNVVMRTTVDPAAVARAAEAELWRSNLEVNVYGLQTLEQAIEDTRWRTTFSTQLVGALAGLALILGVAGIYAVVSHAVARRRRELSLRLALGATRADLVRLVLGGGLRTTALGVALGAVAAVLSARGVRQLLYAAAPVDAVTLGAVGALLILASAAACWWPAVRAARSDPNAALRAD